MDCLLQILPEIKPAEHVAGCSICEQFGNTAIQAFFSGEQAAAKVMRGRVHRYGKYDVVVSYRPLAVKRRPNFKKNFIEDLKLVAKQTGHI